MISKPLFLSVKDTEHSKSQVGPLPSMVVSNSLPEVLPVQFIECFHKLRDNRNKEVISCDALHSIFFQKLQFL